MSNSTFRSAALILCFCAASACVGDTPPASATTSATLVSPTTLYLLRHAEKRTDVDADARDPELNAAGEARAEQLVEVFDAAALDALYSTPYIRARATLAPLAKQLGHEVRVYNPDLDLRRLVDSLTHLHAGERIAIVGHGNTIPGMLNAITHTVDYPMLAEGD